MIKHHLQRFLDLLLPHLDAAIDAGIEHRRVVLKLGVPSTFLFVLLFGWFTGSAGAMVKSLLAVAFLEGGVVGGVIWLRSKYGDELARSRKREAANAIDGFVCDEDYFSAWEAFLEQPSIDPQIELIRLHCKQLPQEYPPPHPGEHCGLLGIEVLRVYVKQLRAGLASMLVDDLRNRQAKAHEEKARKRDGHRFEPDDALGTSTMLDPEPQPATLRMQPEARHDPPAGPTGVPPDPIPPTPDSGSVAAGTMRVTPDRPRSEPVTTGAKPDRESVRPPSPLEIDAALERSAIGATRQPKRPQPPKRSCDAAAATAGKPPPVEAPRPAPPEVEPPSPAPAPAPAALEAPPPAPPEVEAPPAPRAQLTEAGAIREILKAGFTAHDYDYKQFELSEALGRQASPEQVVHALLAGGRQIEAPKESGGALTEAGAIREIMKSGLTAHDYDRKLESLDQRGHEASPADVVAALLEEGRQSPKKKPVPKKKKPKEATQSKPLTETRAIHELMKSGFTAHHYDSKSQELATEQGRPPSPAEVMQALRSESEKPVRKVKKRKARKIKKKKTKQTRHELDRAWAAATGRERRRSPIPLLVLGLPLLPFALWRIPSGDPVTIEGELRNRIYEPAPNVIQFLRNPFESVLGNQGVSLVDGSRLYLTEDDYQRCWPPDLYTAGYRMYVTAEARPLLFGGYGVAKVTDIERVGGAAAVTD